MRSQIFKFPIDEFSFHLDLYVGRLGDSLFDAILKEHAEVLPEVGERILVFQTNVN